MGGSYYSFSCSILSIEKDEKTPQSYLDVPTTSRRISLRSMDSDFAKPVKEISLPKDVLITSNHCLIEHENQVQCLMEAHLAPTQLAQVNKITTSCEICNGPHDTQYCMENLEQAFVGYASSRTDRTRTQMNFTSTNDPTKEELQGMRIKIPSKLLSLKYLSQSSLAKQKRKPSSLKRVHFVNSIVILNKEDESKEEGNVKTSTTEYKDHKMSVESEEEFKEETKDEIKEEDEDSPKHFDTFLTIKELWYHEWLLNNPQTPWVKAKVRTGNLNNVKFSCMIGHFDKKQAYLDMESPINVMSRIHYNWIMSKRLGLRRKPSNPVKIWSIISRKPFVEATGLVHDIEQRTITFEKDKEKIVFKMPHKMEMFKHIDFTDIKTDHIPLFVIESDDDSSRKTHYFDSLDLGPEYKHDKNVCRAIRSLIAMKAKRSKGEVTLYLMRRSLEVLRKFHWMIRGGRFNQLSYVSSLLLSKPEEY
nr:hypothetical protein [Tanacetum cinerariifolium]